jgi:hypothetical protein
MKAPIVPNFFIVHEFLSYLVSDPYKGNQGCGKCFHSALGQIAPEVFWICAKWNPFTIDTPRQHLTVFGKFLDVIQ